MRYNLGCGRRKLEGFVNVDIQPGVNPDIVWDVRKVPWGWAKTDTGDLIRMDNLAEHIEVPSWVKVVKECHRVLKNGGILWIKVPESRDGNVDAMYGDPMHVNRNFASRTFEYYDHRCKRWKNYGSVYGIPRFERITQKSEGRFIIVELKVVK